MEVVDENDESIFFFFDQEKHARFRKLDWGFCKENLVNILNVVEVTIGSVADRK